MIVDQESELFIIFLFKNIKNRARLSDPSSWAHILYGQRGRGGALDLNCLAVLIRLGFVQIIGP